MTTETRINRRWTAQEIENLAKRRKTRLAAERDFDDSIMKLPAASGSIAELCYPLVLLCRSAKLPEPVPEWCFHPTRKWRLDYAWPYANPPLGVEVDGGVWNEGRHTRGAGFIEDQRKLNAAVLLGFRILRYTPDRLAEAIADLKVLLR